METRFMRATFATCALLLLLVFAPGTDSRPQAAAQNKSKTFDIYVIDVEGGKATLFVSPSGESVLLDSGNPVARDTDRIMTVLTEAGVKELDYLVSTHYHVDHIGGMQELAKRIPIKQFHRPRAEQRGA